MNADYRYPPDSGYRMFLLIIDAPVKFAALVPIGNLTPVKRQQQRFHPDGIKDENRFHWAGRAGGVKLMIEDQDN